MRGISGRCSTFVAVSAIRTFRLPSAPWQQHRNDWPQGQCSGRKSRLLLPRRCFPLLAKLYTYGVTTKAGPRWARHSARRTPQLEPRGASGIRIFVNGENPAHRVALAVMIASFCERGTAFLRQPNRNAGTPAVSNNGGETNGACGQMKQRPTAARIPAGAQAIVLPLLFEF